MSRNITPLAFAFFESYVAPYETTVSVDTVVEIMESERIPKAIVIQWLRELGNHGYISVTPMIDMNHDYVEDLIVVNMPDKHEIEDFNYPFDDYKFQ